MSSPEQFRQDETATTVLGNDCFEDRHAMERAMGQDSRGWKGFECPTGMGAPCLNPRDWRCSNRGFPAMVSGSEALMNKIREIGAHSAFFLSRLKNWAYALVEFPFCEATDGSGSSQGSASQPRPDSFRHLGIEVALSLSSSTVLSHFLSRNTVSFKATWWRSLST